MFSEADKFCNFCGVQWCLPGVTPEGKIYVDAKALIGTALIELLKPEHSYFSEL
jgi:hypothetical protein